MGDERSERTFRGGDEVRVPKPGTAAAADEPATPENFDEKALPFPVRAEMRGLPKDLAHTVAAHIWAAGDLIDVDPELAYKHAEAARRRAGRLPVVREAAAETAYAAGHFDVALREYRAIRRMNGGDELVPVMADCERALGKPREALDLLASIKPQDPELRVECLLVEAGVRDDLGQTAEGLRILKAAISERVGPRESQARLQYAYANLLEKVGKSEPAIQWFANAADNDQTGDLDTADRIASLEGVTLPDSMELQDEESVNDEPRETRDSMVEQETSAAQDDLDTDDDHSGSAHADGQDTSAVSDTLETEHQNADADIEHAESVKTGHVDTDITETESTETEPQEASTDTEQMESEHRDGAVESEETE